MTAFDTNFLRPVPTRAPARLRGPMRYRGVAYRRADLPVPGSLRPAVPLVYRGVPHLARPNAPALRPAPGGLRYRGAAH